MQLNDLSFQATLDAQTGGMLASLADNKEKLLSDVAAQLLKEALFEEQEDHYWSELTNQRIDASKSEDNICIKMLGHNAAMPFERGGYGF
jgi:hypothetical protein